MDLAYGTGAYARTRGNLPELPLVNLFVEATRSDQRGVVLQSRKGLVEDTEVGTGPIRGVFRKDGVLGGSEFVVSDDELFEDGVSLGTINGTGPVSFAAIEDEILICAGADIWSYNGSNLVAVTFPDGADVTKVAYSSGYFIALRAGTGQWYFSALYDGRSWDGLDFATAESEPDALLDVVIIDGNPVFFGTQSVEFWSSTGDPEIPFAPIQNRTFEQGIFATGCAVAVDNSFYWVGADKIVYRNDTVPVAVADDGIVERAEGSASLRLFLLIDERHKFVCLRGDTFTMAFDVTTSEWCEFQSYGRTNFRCGPDMGDDTTGIIWRFEGFSDNGGVLERRFRAGATLPGPFRVSRLRLICEVGTTPNLAGEYAEPVIEMRYSDDAGNTWGIWEPETLGAQGNYRQRVEWRALGLFDDPGMLFEHRMTAPVSFRVTAVTANGELGGRSR